MPLGWSLLFYSMVSDLYRRDKQVDLKTGHTRFLSELDKLPPSATQVQQMPEMDSTSEMDKKKE